MGLISYGISKTANNSSINFIFLSPAELLVQSAPLVQPALLVLDIMTWGDMT
jgi:hypothetical protein